MRRFSGKTQGLIAINLAAVILGSAALFGKLPISPVWIVAMRALFAALTLAILGGRNSVKFIGKASVFKTVLTGVILAVHWLSFFASVQLSGVAIATLTFATFPLFTVLITAWENRRKPSVIEIAATLMIIAAVGLLINPKASHANLAGAGAGLFSGLSYALFWYFSKGLTRQLGAFNLSFYQNGVIAAFTVPLCIFATPPPRLAEEWLCLAVVGVVNTALMLQLYLYALERLSASTCSGFVALEPVYAIIFAAVLFHEPLTWWIALSAVLIIVASMILVRLEGAGPTATMS